MNKNQLLVDRIRRVTAFSKTTGRALYSLTEVEDLAIAITADSKTAVDSQGTTVATFEKGKSGTISGSASFINFGLLAAQNGSSGKEATAGAPINFPFYQESTITSVGGTITLLHTPVGTAGAQIKFIYEINADGSLGKDYAQAASTASATEFAVSGTTLTTPTGSPSGTKFGIFYEYAATAGMKYDNNSSDYTTACILKIEIYAASVCNPADLTSVVLQTNNAKLSSAYDLTWSTEGKHPFEFKLDTDYCGTSGKNLFSVYVPE